MRTAFHAQLDELICDLARMVRMTAQLMTDASGALHRADLTLAEGIIASQDPMTATLRRNSQRCVMLLACQAPVATDLRVLIVVLRAMEELDRMGALARHVAKITQLKHPRVVIAAGIAPVAARLGVLAAHLAEQAADIIDTRDWRGVDRLAHADAEIDALRDQLLGVVFGPEWAYGVEPAVDAALLGRYYERFADHAVVLAGQVCYLVTGQSPAPTMIMAPPQTGSPPSIPAPSATPQPAIKIDDQVIQAEAVVLDVAQRRAYVDGHVVHLPARETAVLHLLMACAGQVVYPAALADAAGITDEAPQRAVARLVRRLGRRLQASPLSPTRIHCGGDTGYVFGSGPQ